MNLLCPVRHRRRLVRVPTPLRAIKSSHYKCLLFKGTQYKCPPQNRRGELRAPGRSQTAPTISIEIALEFSRYMCYHTFATQNHILTCNSVSLLSFGKSACSFSYAVMGIRFCVATNGAMRFSVCSSFGATHFLFYGGHHDGFGTLQENVRYSMLRR